jgi:uncharacterized protein (DUF697 family)
VSEQPGAGATPKRPFTTDVPRSSRGRALYVVGLTALGIGIICALVGGWLLAMWAYEDHGQVKPALVIAGSALAVSVVSSIAAGFLLAWAARADRRAAGVEEPQRQQVWATFRSALHQRLTP